ncbi:MAG: glutamine--tRNA ligase/YqeY domain fusion protein [Xanthomonadales bacterium]|nr:glutamine--tRNA ligase/YqeY domain fusion protein [Xanthomonadales bacterium]
MSQHSNSDNNPKTSHFIRNIVIADIDSGKHKSIKTRFPPEPNGFLHIGHAKAICLNFGLAAEFSGLTNLRFDDTNPCKEEEVYARAIEKDVRWLGFDWAELCHASDYFSDFYNFAVELIEAGKAYVEELSADEMREYRGTLTTAGRPSPWRERPLEESLDLFKRMRTGEFEDGRFVLRAKIDMASPNIKMRDPTIYRIRNITHQRTGDEWHIYPMYDFAHCISDALEGITHSLCTLEFEDHRPLYDWVLDNISIQAHPQQIEFARLNLDYTVMSKRRLKMLVDEGLVDGWDDPRMPTLAAMRRRGYPAAAIRNFAEVIGVTKSESIIPLGVLENEVRNELNATAPRAMAVLDPLKVVLLNFPEGETEWFEAARHPQDESMGTRRIPITREIYIERGDFMEQPVRKYFRLKPGGEVRLRNAFIVKFVDLIKDDNGEVIEVHCELDPQTRSGMPESSRRVKGTIHWVSAVHGVPTEVRLYDRLFNVENPLADKDRDFREFINPDCLSKVTAMVEPSFIEAGGFCQFERVGYFCHDAQDSTKEKPVLNRTVSLRDSWAKRGNK